MRLILGLFPPSPPRIVPISPSSVSAPYRSPPPLRFPRLFPCLPRAGFCPSPRIVPISPPRSLPRTGPRLRSRSRACFRVYPRAGLCIGPSLVFASVPVPVSAPVPAPVSVPAPALVPVPVPASSPFPLLGLYPAPVPASVPVPAPVSVPAPRWFLSQSPHRPHFPSSVSAPYRSPPPLRFPRLFPCLFPCLPPRRSLSQSQSQSSFQPPLPFPLLYPCLPLCLLRAGLCPSPSPCLGLRPASVSPALRSVRSSFRVPKVACRTVVLLFPWIPLYSVLLLRFFYPASFLLSLCQGWNSCISKFLVVYLRKI